MFLRRDEAKLKGQSDLLQQERLNLKSNASVSFKNETYQLKEFERTISRDRNDYLVKKQELESKEK